MLVVEKNNRNVVVVVAVVVLLCYSRSSVDINVECKGLMLYALAVGTKISVLK